MVDVKSKTFHAKPLETSKDRAQRASLARHGSASTKSQAGHRVGYTEDPSSGRIDAVGSVVTQLSAGQAVDRGIDEANIRYAKIAGKGRRNILFVVDTSGSMLSAERLALVKGCITSLLEDAYVTRARVAIVSFGGTQARLELPFTTSAQLAANRIDHMKGGGSTPLLQALGIASKIIDQLDGEPVDVVIMSDGRYNRQIGAPNDKTIGLFAQQCKKMGCSILLVDAGKGGKTSRKRAMRLAYQLHARYRQLEAMRADDLAHAVQDMRSTQDDASF